MCGILGLLLHEPKGQACSDLFEGLGYLQHRGQVPCSYGIDTDGRTPAVSSLAEPEDVSIRVRATEWSAMYSHRVPSQAYTVTWASDTVCAVRFCNLISLVRYPTARRSSNS